MDIIKATPINTSKGEIFSGNLEPEALLELSRGRVRADGRPNVLGVVVACVVVSDGIVVCICQ